MLFMVMSTPRPERPSEVRGGQAAFWDWLEPLRQNGTVKDIYVKTGRGLFMVFDLNAVLLGISGGRLTGVRSGRCDITATLAVQGTDLLVKRAHLELRGVISPRRESGSCPPSNTRPPRRKRKTPVPGLPSPGGMRARTPRRTRLPCAVRGYAVCGCPVGGGAVGPAPTHGNALTRSIPTRRWTWGRTCGPLRMSAGRMR